MSGGVGLGPDRDREAASRVAHASGSGRERGIRKAFLENKRGGFDAGDMLRTAVMLVGYLASVVLLLYVLAFVSYLAAS